jgi:hypothetical protein
MPSRSAEFNGLNWLKRKMPAVDAVFNEYTRK